MGIDFFLPLPSSPTHTIKGTLYIQSSLIKCTKAMDNMEKSPKAGVRSLKFTQFGL